MAVCKMQRMNIYGLQTDRKAILERLQRWGCLEVDIPPCEDEALATMDTQSSRQRYERQAQTLSQALDLLEKYAPEQKSALSMLEGKAEVSEAEYADTARRRGPILDAARAVLAADKEISEHRAAAARLQDQIESLRPWLRLDVPLNFTGTEKTRLLLGTVPGTWTAETFLTALAPSLPEGVMPDVTQFWQGKDYAYFAVICLTEDAPKVEECLRALGFARPSQTWEKTAAEAKADCEAAIEEHRAAVRTLRTRLANAGEHRRDFSVLADYYQIRAQKYQVLGKLPQSEKAFLVSGYIPQERAEAVQKDLVSLGAAVELEAVSEEEDTPVLLKNGKFAGMTEGILKSFGLPGKGEIDPSFLTTIFYIFFFGLMLSDAVYGLIVSLVCGVCLLKFPRMGENMKKSLQLFFWCGISTLFWGIMFGSYFGDVVQVVSRTFFGREIEVQPVWFLPLNDPTKLLIYSMLFGLIHLLTGLGCKGYMYLRDHDVVGFLCDVLSWYLLIFGLLIMLLPTELFYSISQMPMHFPDWLNTTGKVLAVAGAAGIVLMSARDKKNPFLRLAMGLYNLYGITGWLSDVLSYSRLLALGMATGVIAEVINQMGSMLGGNVPGAIVFVVVFVIGHAMNIAINMLGAYVHTCRLQYVEFYGKFYEGGGREFEPFRRGTTYVDIKEET